jgi:hypothetical protein
MYCLRAALAAVAGQRAGGPSCSCVCMPVCVSVDAYVPSSMGRIFVLEAPLRFMLPSRENGISQSRARKQRWVTSPFEVRVTNGSVISQPIHVSRNMASNKPLRCSSSC